MEFSLGGLIKPRGENSTPGTLKAVLVTLVKPVAYLKYRVRIRPRRLAFPPAAGVVLTPHGVAQWPCSAAETAGLEPYAVSGLHRHRQGLMAARAALVLYFIAGVHVFGSLKTLHSRGQRPPSS